MSNPFKLYRLQQIDNQLDRAHNRLKEVEIILSDDSALQQALHNVEEKQTALQAARKELRIAEFMVQDQRKKIKHTETKLYSGKIKNPKELQDLQNEAVALKRYLSVLEDRQLETMLIVDDKEAEHQNSQKSLMETRERHGSNQERLVREKVVLENDIIRLEDERLATISSISIEGLEDYERLRKTRGGFAVAKVTHKSCDACGSTLSASLLQAARSPNQTTHCASCGRILYAG